MIQPILEEGIADGSICTDYPKELSEVLMLMGNLWLNPLVYHCDTLQLINRMRFFQHMLRLLGLDIIDDEMFIPLEKYAQLYQEHQVADNTAAAFFENLSYVQKNNCSSWAAYFGQFSYQRSVSSLKEDSMIKFQM